jgi:hypothetical protein
VWNRFGEEVGCVLDEVNPASGARVFAWDGVDSRGRAVPPGDYLVRLTADDVAVSSFLTVQAPASIEGARARGVAQRRLPRATPQRPRLATVPALLAEPAHDLDWLRNALQVAIQLELSTLPPYLTARWTIQSGSDPVARSIYQIRQEEMFHFGLACNLLAAVGGVPLLADDAVVPKYPGPLPGGVRPGLVVSLRKLSREQAAVFMAIEYPQTGPVTRTDARADTIGEFYEAILAAFGKLKPVLSVDRQLDGFLDLFKVDSPGKVEDAIRLINLQGEGSNKSPEERPGDLAHFYRFGEIFHGKRLIVDAQGHWDYKGPDLPMPAVHDMADVPPGGYRREDVPDIETWDLIERFDGQYSGMLRQLQDAWVHGDPSILGGAIGQMGAMGVTGRKLVQQPRPDGRGNYGPCFRFVP